jgi:hypothetical protein
MKTERTIVVMIALLLAGAFAAAGDRMETARNIIHSRFGNGQWTDSFIEEIVPLADAGKVSPDILGMVLRECGNDITGMDPADAAFALFTFAYECDISVKHGTSPVKLRFEARSMMKAGDRDLSEFKVRFRERMQRSLKMIQELNDDRINQKMNRFFGRMGMGPGKGGP